MASTYTAKPASASHAEPVSGSEFLPSSKLSSNTQLLADKQARWLVRRFSISSAMASAVAPHVFGEVRP
jgi:hypothetical protein